MLIWQVGFIPNLRRFFHFLHFFQTKKLIGWHDFLRHLIGWPNEGTWMLPNKGTGMLTKHLKRHFLGTLIWLWRHNLSSPVWSTNQMSQKIMSTNQFLCLKKKVHELFSSFLISGALVGANSWLRKKAERTKFQQI